MKWLRLSILCLALSAVALFADETLMLRQPHVHGDQVVFVYGGDLYTAHITGGTAKQLTAFDGFEVFPRFSPDGKWIAFSGEYSGTRQIYIIPSQGGTPRQLTYYPDAGAMPPRGGWDNLPYDWTADSRHILVRSARTPYGERIGKYFLVSIDGKGMEQALQIPEGGPASLSPDGKKVAYSIKSREFRTWKRYKAGFAMDIWVYDLEENAVERITDYAGTDNFPMWIGNRIYFNSDRSDADSKDPRTLNLYVYDFDTRSTRKVTHFNDYDVMRPSRGQGGIVFENGGAIYYMDVATEKAEKIVIEVNNDRRNARPMYKDASKFVDSWYLSPSGKRALFTARGDLFTVPAEHGDIRNITNTPAIREINVDWSPDGKYISYVSEATGDYELYIQAHGASEAPIRLTENTKSWIMGYQWSPDSKKVLVGDKKNRLRLVDVATRKIKTIDTGVYSQISGYRWSPDNQWVVYCKNDENWLSSIWVYSLAQEKTYRLTSDRYNDRSPVFSADGKTLSFVSSRDFNFRNRDFQAKLYIGTLTADQESPFKPLSDEELGTAEKKDSKDKEEKKDKGKGEKKAAMRIDVPGFAHRVTVYPLPVGGYFGLAAVKDGLVYQRNGALYRFTMTGRKEEKIMSGVRGVVLSGDNKKFMYRAGSDYGIADLRAGVKAGTGKLDLSSMRIKVDPQVEWKQIYTDAWRIMRDWFYDPGMHGVDWNGMYDKYLPLVSHVAHRTDLDYIIGELIGELNAGHCYVNSGDAPQTERIGVGCLGAELKPGGTYYQFATIFPGANWNENLRSPLTEAGVRVAEGEYLIAIDGHEIKTTVNPFKYLENKAGKLVTLTVNDKPSYAGAREITLRTIASDLPLRHHAWVERNRAMVHELSGGRIGYVYVPNTGFPGFRAFYEGWQNQFHKEGLVIDDRYNGGGNLPHQMVLDMAYPALQYWSRRNLPLYTSPFRTHEGPKVMLINGRSSSGGDAFPDYFQEMKLGPLMGQTTWGGLIGYSGSPRFADGGGLAVPQFAYVNRDGRWDVEYYGVQPDIEVFDDPALIQAGREPMLEEAVNYILDALKQNPIKKIKTPRHPNRR